MHRHPAHNKNQAFPAGLNQHEGDTAKSNILVKRDPLNPGLGQGLNFSKAYLQKPSDDPLVPGEEKKNKTM